MQWVAGRAQVLSHIGSQAVLGRMTITRGESGRYLSAFTGPNNTTTGVPAYAAIWAGPESVPMNTSDRAMIAAVTSSDVLPTAIAQGKSMPWAKVRARSASGGPPTTMT